MLFLQCAPSPCCNAVCLSFSCLESHNEFRHDLRSHVARQMLQVAFTDNPQTDGLELTGEVEFPNLVVDTQVRLQCAALMSLFLYGGSELSVGLGLENPG